MTANPLTPRQAEILDFIRCSIASNGYPPTRAEIATHFGFLSQNAAFEHVRAIAKKGYLTLLPNISRGIRIANEIPVSVANGQGIAP